MHCGAEALHGGGPHGVHVGGKQEENTGYLVLVKYEYDEDKPLDWAGETLDIRPTAETTITLSQIEVRWIFRHFLLTWLSNDGFMTKQWCSKRGISHAN